MGAPKTNGGGAEIAALKQQADADKVEAIQDRLSRDTRQLLLRFGRGGSSGPFSGASLAPIRLDTPGAF